MNPPPSHLRAHVFGGLAPGPRLIVLGAVHGNETCGMHAITRAVHEIDAGRLRIEAGQLTLLPVTNPLAHALGQRQGERNLNRHLFPKPEPRDFEDRVANVLCPWLAAHDVLLDLHSFHTPGAPFAMLGPRDNAGALEPFAHAAAEQRMAAHVGPQRIVEGWLEAYARGVQRRADPAGPIADAWRYGVGTTEYMRTCGGYGLTLECGQHADAAAPEVAWHAIRQTLALLGMADLSLQPPPDSHEVLKLEDVIDRAHADDRFDQPWTSFAPLQRGQLIGTRHDGREVRAPDDGFIVFPNPGALPGNEWFYFARPSDRPL